MSAKGRAAAKEAAQRTVRLSVPLDGQTHAKLVWLATSEGKDRSALAAEFIRAALVGVQCRDERKGGAGPDVALAS